MPATLIKNGRIVNAVDDYVGDILIEDGRVRTLGRNLKVRPDVSVHDATGLLVIPGGVDVHTHMDWDFGPARTVDSFETGTRAAAFGGTTTLVDFANQTKGQGLIAGLEDWRRRAESACIDVGAHIIILDVTRETLSDMVTLIRDGVTSFKLFTASPGVLMVDDGSLFRVMRVAGANSAMICCHAENGPVGLATLGGEAPGPGRRPANQERREGGGRDMSGRTPAEATRLIENDRVRVTRWRLAPGTATGWHRHEYDYVIVPLTTGPMKLDEPDGERTVQLETGVPYFREAGVEHDVVNEGDKGIVFIEVEIV